MQFMRSTFQDQMSKENQFIAQAVAQFFVRPDGDIAQLFRDAEDFIGRQEDVTVSIDNLIEGKRYNRVNRAENEAIPSWFVNAISLQPDAGKADIYFQNVPLAKVSVEKNASDAYAKLWQFFKRFCTALAVVVALEVFVLMFVLKRQNKPLQDIIEQARAISERRFITIAEPKIPELKEISHAMNFAVERLKAFFQEEANRLEIVRRKANYDELTELANRTFFQSQLHTALEVDETSAGTLMLIRIANLADVNRRLGREATDNVILGIAKQLKHFMQRIPDSFAARISGTDFALIVPQQDQEMIAHDLLLALVSESNYFLGDEPVAYIGVGPFQFGMDMSILLSRVDSALAAAEAGGISAVRMVNFSDNHFVPRSADQWYLMIQSAIEQRWTQLATFPLKDFEGNTLHQECPIRLKLREDGNWLTAGHFFPSAERLGFAPQIDLVAVQLGLEQLEDDALLPGIAINLSAKSIHDAHFRKKLHLLLDQHHLASQRLWLEVSEIGALAQIDEFRAFCMELRRCPCRVGIEHFGRQFSKIGLLHDLGIDYLKVDASFIDQINSHAGNQHFLLGLCSIAHNIGMQVFAEGVSSQEEINSLQTLGFDGVTGPFIREVDPYR